MKEAGLAGVRACTYLRSCLCAQVRANAYKHAETIESERPELSLRVRVQRGQQGPAALAGSARASKYLMRAVFSRQSMQTATFDIRDSCDKKTFPGRDALQPILVSPSAAQQAEPFSLLACQLPGTSQVSPILPHACFATGSIQLLVLQHIIMITSALHASILQYCNSSPEGGSGAHSSGHACCKDCAC